MKTQFNEIIKLQKLAGILNENEDVNQSNPNSSNNKTGEEKIDSKTELRKQLLNIIKMLEKGELNPSSSEIKAISDLLQTVLSNVNKKELGQPINKVRNLAQNLTTQGQQKAQG